MNLGNRTGTARHDPGPILPPELDGLFDAMGRALDGEEAKLNDWMESRFPVLVRVLRSWTGNADLAERVALRVTEVAFLRCRGGFYPRTERPWLAQVAKRQRLEALRSTRSVGGPLPGDLMAPGSDPIDAAAQGERQEAVRTAIATLPVKYRLTLHQRYVLGATEPEVAAWVDHWTGVGRDETHRILREGRQMVRALLRGEDPRRTWPRRFTGRMDRWTTTPPPRFPAHNRLEKA